MKKTVSLLICAVFLFGCAAAEQTVVLPESRYVIDVPDGMEYSAPEDGDLGVHAYISEALEMNYRSDPREETAFGQAASLRETADTLAAGGADVEMREVNGIGMLVYRVTDETDGTPCIGYVFEDGDRIIEIFFWYATQEAADTTKTIMESIRTGNAE